MLIKNKSLIHTKPKRSQEQNIASQVYVKEIMLQIPFKAIDSINTV